MQVLKMGELNPIQSNQFLSFCGKLQKGFSKVVSIYETLSKLNIHVLELSLSY